jgi:hypothetical protein
MALAFFHGEYLVGWMFMGALAVIAAIGIFLAWFSHPPRNPGVPTAVYFVAALVGFAMWLFDSPNLLISSLSFALTLPWSAFILFDIQIPSSVILLGIFFNTVVLYFAARSMRAYRVDNRNAG